MNNKIKRILPQLLTILFVVFVFGFFTINAQVNMDNRGIDFGFGFLSQEASFDMQFTLLDYDGQDSYLWAYVVALLNTLLVSFLGIIFCTILGVIIGVARLSQNFLIKNSAAWYVEFFRNIPLLLQIFFWYYAALRALPLPENAEPWFGVTYMTIKGYYIPSMIWENLNVFMSCLIAAIVAIFFTRIFKSLLLVIFSALPYHYHAVSPCGRSLILQHALSHCSPSSLMPSSLLPSTTHGHTGSTTDHDQPEPFRTFWKKKHTHTHTNSFNLILNKQNELETK